MQEQLIRYSESVRSVDAAYKEMTDRVSDHTQELNRLDTRITEVEGSFIKMLTDTMEATNNDLLRVEGRVDALESHNRTFWTRVRFLFLGR